MEYEMGLYYYYVINLVMKSLKIESYKNGIIILME